LNCDRSRKAPASTNWRKSFHDGGCPPSPHHEGGDIRIRNLAGIHVGDRLVDDRRTLGCFFLGQRRELDMPADPDEPRDLFGMLLRAAVPAKAA
jgi:hypothetical protein